jgi:hypothetical protein
VINSCGMKYRPSETKKAKFRADRYIWCNRDKEFPRDASFFVGGYPTLCIRSTTSDIRLRWQKTDEIFTYIFFATLQGSDSHLEFICDWSPRNPTDGFQALALQSWEIPRRRRSSSKIGRNSTSLVGGGSEAFPQSSDSWVGITYVVQDSYW